MPSLKTEPVAILLAAGQSSRMGVDKLSVVMAGRTLLHWTLKPYKRAEKVQDILVVIPPGTRAQFEPYRSSYVHLVENPDPSRGQISSIRAGLESGWAQERSFLVGPADMPFVTPKVIDQLVTTYLTRDCKIVIPTYKGLGGHPGLFSHELRDDFFLRGDEQGAREVIARHRHDLVRINVQDPGVCFDIDTMNDLEIALDADARRARVEEEVKQKRVSRR